jgi:hypothetical protein
MYSSRMQAHGNKRNLLTSKTLALIKWRLRQFQTLSITSALLVVAAQATLLAVAQARVGFYLETSLSQRERHFPLLSVLVAQAAADLSAAVDTRMALPETQVALMA